MVTTENWASGDGTRGSAYNSKPQKMPSFAHRTLEELPTNAQENVTTGKQQEEGFAGGLPARNARMFRHRPAPVVGTPLSRGTAVDNLWITMELIHMPRIRV